MYRLLNKKHKKILQGSILLSLCLHVIGIFFLQKQSFWFSSEKTEKVLASSWLTSMEKTKNDQILKEVFQTSKSEESDAKDKNITKPFSENFSIYLAKPESFFPIEGARENSGLKEDLDLFPKGELLSSSQIISFSLPSKETLNLFEHLPKDLILTSSLQPNLTVQFLIPPLLQMETNFSSISPPPIQEQPETLITLSQEPEPDSKLTEAAISPSVPPSIQISNLPKIPSLSELKTISYSDSFDTDLIFLPQDDGYIFALTLIPRPDLRLATIKQNYFFLIDRSNSIQRERLNATKSAVRKAIEELDGSDTFNIIAFDNKLEKFSTISLPVTAETIKKAEAFLDKIDLGSFFSQADLFKALFLTIPSIVKEDELYTAILLTDGENLDKKGSSKSLLSEWTRYNDGRVSLYTLGMGGDSNLAALDTASAFNRGKLYKSPTKRGLKRKLLKLMKSIHAPVSKNLSCRGISLSSSDKIELYPKANQTPNLYLNEPYVILGKTNSLNDFVLFVQGRLNGEWLHIKKSISFLSAKKGNSSLKEQWALQKSYELYDLYLQDNDPQHLAEVRSLLEPLDLQMALE